MRKTSKKITLSELRKVLLKLPVEERKELIERAKRWREFKLIRGGRDGESTK